MVVDAMRRIEELRVVLELACLTEDRDNSEHKAMLSLAKKLDKEANSQRGTNPLIRNEPYTDCTFREGPPETHDRPKDPCKCSPAPGQPGRLQVQVPEGGWWRLTDMVEDTRVVQE